MGNRHGFTSPHTVCNDHLHEIFTGNHTALIESSDVRQINFQDIESHNPFHHEYAIMLDALIPRDCQLVLLFPNHPVEKQRVLYSNHYSQLYQLGIAINERIRESHQWTFAILVSDQIYEFLSVTGNIYVVWCIRANQRNRNNQCISTETMCPCIVQMDGRGRVTALVLLNFNTKYQVIPLKNLKMFTPCRTVIFACETNPPESLSTRGPIHTHSIEEAISKTMARPLDTQLVLPPLPDSFVTDSDGEEDNGEMMLTMATPRMRSFGIAE
jgi:hypothetical protein